MGKVYPRFQTKTAQKTLPDGAAQTYMAYIREYPPPPGQKEGIYDNPLSMTEHDFEISAWYVMQSYGGLEVGNKG